MKPEPLRGERTEMEVYRREVTGLPRPTDTQVDDFVAFVAEAHSWYKKLRLVPPGTPFTFFLNPSAGMEVRLDRSGQVDIRERTPDSQRFHYTWMTTADYRRRFGLLDYSTRVGTSFALDHCGEDLLVLSDTKSMPMPASVRDAGTVNLTSVIHPLAPRLVVLVTWARLEKATWPEETGGEKTLLRIKRIAEERDFEAQQSGPRIKGARLHPELEELFLPERKRLRESMRSTISRMLDLVFA